jgi:hypothetical protein
MKWLPILAGVLVASELPAQTPVPPPVGEAQARRVPPKSPTSRPGENGPGAPLPRWG